MFISYSLSQRSPELPTSAAAVIRATISSTSASLYHRRPCHCRSCAHQDLALATATVILVFTIAPCTFQSASAAALTEPSVSLHHARRALSVHCPSLSLHCQDTRALGSAIWCPASASGLILSLHFPVQGRFSYIQ